MVAAISATAYTSKLQRESSDKFQQNIILNDTNRQTTDCKMNNRVINNHSAYRTRPRLITNQRSDLPEEMPALNLSIDTVSLENKYAARGLSLQSL